MITRKHRIATRGIETRAKALGFEIPRAFVTLVRCAAEHPQKGGFFDVLGTDPRVLGVGAAAAKQLVPFLRLGDGGVLAWWTADEGRGAVVHLGSEGERALVAASLDDLLVCMKKRAIGVPDLDEAESPLPLELPARRVASLKSLAAAFVSFCARDAASMAPPADPTGDLEALRARLVAAAAAMIRDGLSRVYRPKDYWVMSLRVERRDPRAPVEYQDYGAWHPVPKKYDVAGDVRALLAVAKRPKPCSEIGISCAGIVDVDRGRALELMPARTQVTTAAKKSTRRGPRRGRRTRSGAIPSVLEPRR